VSRHHTLCVIALADWRSRTRPRCAAHVCVGADPDPSAGRIHGASPTGRPTAAVFCLVGLWSRRSRVRISSLTSRTARRPCQPPGVTAFALRRPQPRAVQRRVHVLRTESNRRGSRVVCASNSRANPALLLRLRTAFVDGYRRVSAQSSAQTPMQLNHSEKWEIPLECGIEHGETRTRTGDTTIFSRAAGSLKSVDLQGIARDLTAVAASEFPGFCGRLPSVTADGEAHWPFPQPAHAARGQARRASTCTHLSRGGS